VEYTFLGPTREKISRIGLGTWQFSDTWGVKSYEVAKGIIEEAHRHGINLIDTAIVYGDGLSEEFIGRALEELGLREEFLIASKIPGQFLAWGDVIRAVEASLRRLRVDAIDLMQVHWPPVWHNIPTCEYMRALERLVSLGKIRYIGLSNFPPVLAWEAQECLAREEIVSLQVRYNLLERDAEKELLPYAEENNMTLLAWSPLAKGALTGKYTPENLPEFEDVRRGDPVFHPDNFKRIWPVVEELRRIAEKHGKTTAQAALNWLITSSDAVVPIPGAKRREQVADNAGAAGWRMGFEEWARLEELSRRAEIVRVLW